MNNIEVILALISVLEMLTICQAGRIAIYMVKWTMDVNLTTSESLLRWWNIKEAKTIPGTRTVGSAAMLFVFRSPEERYYCAMYSQPQRRTVEFSRLRFSCAVTWVFYAARRVCFSGLNHLLLEDFLCRRRIKHCREYFTTVQVFISLCRFAFPP